MIYDVIARHERIALQFSGGKDSIATLLVMRDFLDKITVYWLDTDDTYPETVEVIEWAKRIAPNFVTVKSDVHRVIDEFGLPSNIVPSDCGEPAAVAHLRGALKIQDNIACCVRTIMLPMQRRMAQDDVTLIIRGQKSADRHKGPLRSGAISEGAEYLYPIESWTDDQVMDFIRGSDAPIPRMYQEGLGHLADCVGCSAWNLDGKADYLAKYHPERLPEWSRRIIAITAAVTPYGAMLADQYERIKELEL